MKKFLSIIMMAVALLIGNTALPDSMLPQASASFEYWHGDTNYPCLYTQMGTSWYLDRSSVVIQRNEDGDKIVAAIVVTASQSEVKFTQTLRWRDYNGTFYCSNTANGGWEEFDPIDGSGHNAVRSWGCRWAWKTAFGYWLT